MASIMEELVAALTREQELYEQLIPVAEEKTQVLVRNDLAGLQRITNQEQELVDQVTASENRRMDAVRNMAVVLNRKPEELNLNAIIGILDKQPQEQKRLRQIHDQLSGSVRRLQDINTQNKALIEQSLEMIEFNMNFIRSTRMSSGSSNYTKNASIHDADVSQAGSFDAKQ